MNNQLVSVVIPMFNREQTIERAIESVLKQTYSNLEVIVVDDGSSDRSVSIVQQLTDERVRIYCLEHNSGAACARNEGIRHAKGDFIAFQDSDDEWLENKLEIQIKYMDKTGVDACFCPFWRFNNVTGWLVPNPEEYIYDKVEQDLKKILAVNNTIGTPTLVIRREVIESVGVFDASMPKMEDYEYILRIVKKFNMGFVPNPLVKTYVLGDSLNASVGDFEAWNIILKKHGDIVRAESAIYNLLHQGVRMSSNMVDQLCTDDNTNCRNMMIDYYFNIH